MENQNNQKKTKIFSVRFIAMTAMLSAVAFILMFLDFNVPIMPFFIKMDISELPALVGTFAFGPVCGVLICLIKNLLHLFITTTGGVGELSNFLLGASMVLVAGIIYERKKTKMTATIAVLVGALVMGVISIPINLFITYPVYYNFMAPEAVLEAYQIILPSMKSILQCLIVFNAPFTFVKGLICALLAMLIYKPLSPIIKGNR